MALHLTNARIIDCVGDDLRPVVGTVVIEGGLIAAVEPGSPPAPAGGAAIDLRGAYLLPGLWDVHCHPGGMIPDPNRVSLFESEAGRTLRATRNTMAALRAGVVALRAVGEASFLDIALRETYANRLPGGLWRKGYTDKPLVGPRMFCAGPTIRTTGGHAANGRVEEVFVRRHVEVDGTDEMRKAARHCIKMGVDWIKLAITGGIAGVRESMYEIQMTLEEIQTAWRIGQDWKAAHGSSMLEAFDGDELMVIYDTRPWHPSETYVVEGTRRAVYIAAASAQSPAQIADLLRRRGVDIGEAAVRSILMEFLDADLVLREGDLFLSLALIGERSYAWLQGDDRDVTTTSCRDQLPMLSS